MRQRLEFFLLRIWGQDASYADFSIIVGNDNLQFCVRIIILAEGFE
jgi:hypothetical protein